MIALRVFGSVLHFLLKGGTVTGTDCTYDSYLHD